MGKAANNEALKLRSSFYNNLAAGVMLGGFFIPYFAVVQRMDEIKALKSAFSSGAPSLEDTDIQRVAVLLFTFVVACMMSFLLRVMANTFAAQIED